MDGHDEAKYVSLRRFNLAMGVLHLVQGVLVLVLSNDSTLPITASYVDFDPVTETFVSTDTTLFELWLGPMVAAFLFMSAIAHFSVGTVGQDWYERNLRRGINKARWYEYTLSSSVMIVLIAMFVGIYDFAALVFLFGVNAAMNLMGLMMEVHNQTTEGTNWTAYNIGVFMAVVAWVPIFLYLVGVGGPGGREVPGFVYGIFISIALFYNTFAINMWLQYRKRGRWADYLYGERMYIVLSLVSKSALAWQVFAGTLR
jgi:hypothetical protein